MSLKSCWLTSADRDEVGLLLKAFKRLDQNALQIKCTDTPLSPVRRPVRDTSNAFLGKSILKATEKMYFLLFLEI